MIQELGNLTDQKIDSFGGLSPMWFNKLSEQGKKNSNELYHLYMKGYDRSIKSVRRPIISSRYVKISPVFLQDTHPHCIISAFGEMEVHIDYLGSRLDG
jgi:hypothetical protein